MSHQSIDVILIYPRNRLQRFLLILSYKHIVIDIIEYLKQLVFIQSSMGPKRDCITIQDNAIERKETFDKIARHNTRANNQSSLQLGIQIVDLDIQFDMPDFDIPIPRFVESNRFIPKPPRQINTKLKFPIYHKMFNTIYYLIGTKNQGIWNDFAEAYSEVMADNKQKEPLVNLSDIKEIEQLQAFIQNGMQIRLLIQNINTDTNDKMAKKIVQENLRYLSQLIQKKQVIQLCISDQVSGQFQGINLNKKIEKVQMKKQFNKNIRKYIKKSCKTKIHYNFVSIQSKSSEVVQRKKLIQECLQPKEKQQYVEHQNKFIEILQSYQNKRYTRQIQLLQQSREPNKQNLIRQKQEAIIKIQQEQKKFCLKFLDWIVQKHPFQNLKSQHQKQIIYFQIVKEYTEEHSIYEILNNSIRLSLCINENVIKCLSPFIKYFYQAVRYFFFKQMENKDFSKSKLYRAALIPIDEIEELKAGKFIFNIGFMSTSKSKNVMKGFHDTNKYNYPDFAYEIQISFNDNYKIQKFYDNQEGFIDVTEQHRRHATKDKMAQQQIIFNPLNVFKVIEIYKQKKIIYLQYAAHITLMQKMESGTMTIQEQQQFDEIIPQINALKRTNYDKGLILMQKGQTVQAITYYQEAEQKGEITVQQKFYKCQAYAKNKDYDQIQKLVQQYIKQTRNQILSVKKLQQVEESEEQKFNKIEKLTKQSQILQISSNFNEAQKRAKEATDKSQELSKQIKSKQSQGKRVSTKEILKSLEVKIKSTLELSKSRFEKNKNKQSIQNSYVGFKLIDQLYTMIQNKIYPKIQNLIQKQSIPNNENRFKFLPHLISISEQNKVLRQKNLRQKIDLKIIDEENIRNSRNISEVFKQQREKQKGDKSQRSSNKEQQFISNYYKTRKINDKCVIFYKAAEQIEYLSCSTLNLNTAKNLLLSLKQSLDNLIEYENDYYDIMTQNLRALNFDIMPCLNSQKQIFYDERFTKIYETQNFQKQNSIIQERRMQLDTNRINRLGRYAKFLLLFQDLNASNSKIGYNKGLQIIENLKTHVNQQSEVNQVELTTEKTNISQSKKNYYKRYLNEGQIIEKAAILFSSESVSTNASTIKTIGGSQARNKEAYRKLKQTLIEIQQIHKNDSKINQFYYLLTDVIDQITVMNNSNAVADEYEQQLKEASEKIQNFKRVFNDNFEQAMSKKNQLLSQFYFVAAQNDLRRGFYLEAEKNLLQAKKIFEKIYTGQDYLQLYARPIPVKCYGLQSQIIGTYGDKKQKSKFLNNLKNIKQYIERKIPNPTTRALINEAFAFVSMRYLPRDISFVQKTVATLRSCINLRRSMVGENNQFLAIAYSSLVQIQSTLEQPPAEIDRDYEKGKIIMQNLMDEFEHCPILYLYYMKMQVSYKQARKRSEDKDIQISAIYKKCIDNFIKYNNRLSLTFAEDILTGGKYLMKNKQYKKESEKYLKQAENDIKLITSANVGKEKQNTNKQLNFFLYSLYDSLVQYYRRHGNSKQKEHYKKEKMKINKKIEELTNHGKVISVQPPTFIDFIFQNATKCFGTS